MASKRYDFDYTVIGSGPAGKIGAMMAANSGLKTAIIEANYWGGTGFARDLIAETSIYFAHENRKTNIDAIKNIYDTKTRLNLQTLALKRRKLLAQTQEDTYDGLISSNVKCIHGMARFTSSHTIKVGSKEISSEMFLIATGSKFASTSIKGVQKTRVLTSENAYNAIKPPRTIFVVGGGASGCEIAQYYSSLGSKVVLADLSSRILPKEDEDVSEYMMDILRRSGITVLPQTRVIAVSEDERAKYVTFLRDGASHNVAVNAIVLATGIEPNLNFDPEVAGLKLKNNAIIYTPFLQTSAKNIWVAGDITGGVVSNEKSEYESALATANAINRTKNAVNYSGFVKTINSFPNIASVGLTEDDCLRRDIKYRKIQVPISDTLRAKIIGREAGLIKLIVDKSKQKKILGATIIADEAAILIQEIALAVRHEMPIEKIISTPHVLTAGIELLRLAARQI